MGKAILDLVSKMPFPELLQNILTSIIY